MVYLSSCIVDGLELSVIIHIPPYLYAVWIEVIWFSNLIFLMD